MRLRKNKCILFVGFPSVFSVISVVQKRFSGSSLRSLFPRFILHPASFILFFLLAAPAARAQNATWSGNSTVGFWGDGTNWIGGVAPTTTGTATFSNTSSNQIVQMIGTTVGGLVFNNTGTTLLHTGGAAVQNTSISLGAGGITVNAGAGAVRIGHGTSPLRLSVGLSASQVWTNNSNNTLTVDGAGTNPFVMGANTLTMSGPVQKWTETVQKWNSHFGTHIRVDSRINAGSEEAGAERRPTERLHLCGGKSPSHGGSRPVFFDRAICAWRAIFLP